MKVLRILLILAGLALVLVVANQNIRMHQEIVESGTRVMLELQPVDPRSLIQGDYMFLRYAENIFPSSDVVEALPSEGTFVMALDADDVGTYLRMDDGTPLAANEIRLQFKHRTMWGEVSIGAETFNFEEGQAEVYSAAKYGVLRVDESGKSVLVGLADEHRALIAP
ncbi:MAG: hypothetical protein GWN47_10940 [Woeseiaceae bacterium]|nr:hypothetical protein [Woeseiaceae bacterium]